MIADCLTIAPESWFPIVIASIILGIGIGIGVMVLLASTRVVRQERWDRWEAEVTRGRLLHPSTRQGEKWEE